MVTAAGSVDASSRVAWADDDHDDELARLREQEEQLRAAYLKNPFNRDAERAYVRVEQQIRRREEDMQRLASNAIAPAESPNASRATVVRLDAQPAMAAPHTPAIWAPLVPKMPPPTAADALDLVTPVERFDKATAHHQAQLVLSHLTIPPHDPALLIELGKRMTALQMRIAQLEAAEKPKAPPDLGPKMLPVAQLGTMGELAHAIDRERAFLASPLAKLAAARVRHAHEQYLETLVGERNRRVNEYLSRPEVQKQRLYAELAKLGDTSGCRDGDTVDSLRARRDELLRAKATQWDETEAARWSMGLDGAQGKAEDLEQYTLREGVKAINPGSGTGILFAAAAAVHGGSIEDIRAAGEAGNALEDIGGGVGHALNTNRASTNDTRRRGATTGLGTSEGRVRARYGAVRLPPEIARWTRPIRSSGPLPSAIPLGEDGIARINGRRPRSFEQAGQLYRLKPEIAARYPEGVRFNANGFPDFTPYAVASVEVEELKGNTGSDYRLANEAAGLGRYGSEAPRGFVWHHCEDGKTMQLVPSDLHNAVDHTGGEAVIKHLRETP